jgi:hypothetical protein
MRSRRETEVVICLPQRLPPERMTRFAEVIARSYVRRALSTTEPAAEVVD